MGLRLRDLLQIVDCAFGRQVKEHKRVKKGKKDWEEKEINKLETDEQIQRRYLQQLVELQGERRHFPAGYSESTDATGVLSAWPLMKQTGEKSCTTACAALQKYRYDTKQGGNEMAWELDTNKPQLPIWQAAGYYGMGGGSLLQKEICWGKGGRSKADKCNPVYLVISGSAPFQQLNESTVF